MKHMPTNRPLPKSTSPYEYLPVKYPPLSPEDLDAFLGGKYVSNLATVSKDGSPHVKPVWFKWEKGRIWVMTWLKCKTVTNIQRNNRVAISIDPSVVPVNSFPSAGCLIHGEATLVPEIKNKIEPDSWHFRIFAKYLGEENCYKPPTSIHLANPDMAICVKPTKILSWDFTKIPTE